MSRPTWLAGIKGPEEEQRRHRLARCAPEWTIRGMYYAAILEAVRRGNPSALPEVLAAEGIAKPDFSTLGRYPLAKYIALQTRCALALKEQVGSFEEAVHRLGRSAVEVFLESMAGRTFRMLAGKDVHRFMKAGPGAYGFALEDGAKRDYVYLGERSAELTFVDDMLGPCHHCGVMDSALVLTGAPYRLEVNQSSTTEFKVRVRW